MIRSLTLAAISVVGCGITFGQPADPGGPTFEVASVKRNTSGGEPHGDDKGDRLTLLNMPLKVVIAQAYRVSIDRVVGPAWLDTEGYDIVAKPGPGAAAETEWAMMRNLLAERFKLVAHRDSTPVPVYALVVGKNGPKLQEPSADSRALERGRNTCRPQGAQLTCQCQKMTMADLARNLPRWVSRNWFELPIVDQTGLDGAHDFSLTWTPANRTDDAAGAADPSGTSLFEALQDQLGLKLERRKAPLDRIVVDHIERIPTEN